MRTCRPITCRCVGRSPADVSAAIGRRGHRTHRKSTALRAPKGSATEKAPAQPRRVGRSRRTHRGWQDADCHMLCRSRFKKIANQGCPRSLGKFREHSGSLPRTSFGNYYTIPRISRDLSGSIAGAFWEHSASILRAICDGARAGTTFGSSLRQSAAIRI